MTNSPPGYPDPGFLHWETLAPIWKYTSVLSKIMSLWHISLPFWYIWRQQCWNSSHHK